MFRAEDPAQALRFYGRDGPARSFELNPFVSAPLHAPGAGSPSSSGWPRSCCRATSSSAALMQGGVARRAAAGPRASPSPLLPYAALLVAAGSFSPFLYFRF